MINKNQAYIKESIIDAIELLKFDYEKNTIYKMKSTGKVVTDQSKLKADAWHDLYHIWKDMVENFEEMIK